MNPRTFRLLYQEKAPTRGGCWTVESHFASALWGIYDPAQLVAKELRVQVEEDLRRIYDKRFQECKALMKRGSDFPAETIAELEKLPQHSMEQAKETFRNANHRERLFSSLNASYTAQQKRTLKTLSDAPIHEIKNGNVAAYVKVKDSIQDLCHTAEKIADHVQYDDLSSLALDGRTSFRF